VTRGLPTGATAANAHLHGKLLASITTELAPDFLPGEPVMITANDHERGLYNGDQGVVVRVEDDDGAQRWRAVFRRSGELVPLPIDAVRGSLELAWAMTVHKSQGSELERVALILPREDLPLVTRELLYTALTRARRGVIVLGAWAVFERGVARTAARASGLAARIP
jgi:exodeoxyribonuclease V alpha subunit